MHVTTSARLAAPGGGQVHVRSLRSNFTWTFFSNAIYAACQWVMLVILAKVGNPTLVGQFVLGTAVSAPIFMLFNMHLRGVQATDARHEFTFGDYLALRIVASFAALVAIDAIVVVFGYSGTTAAVILIIGLGRALDAVSDIYYGLLQQQERMDAIAPPMIANGALSVLGLALGMLVGNSVVWAATGWTVASGLALAVNVRRTPVVLRQGASVVGAFRPRWSTATARRLTALSLPLGISTLLGSLTTNVPRYVVEHELGSHELGIFVALASVTVVGTTVVSALGQAVSPRLARAFAAKDVVAFRALLLRLVTLGVAGGFMALFVAIVAGGRLLTLLYAAEYASDRSVFVWLMAGSGIAFVASFLGFAMTSMRRFRLQVPLTAASLVVLAVSSALLIPRYGLNGAAVAYLAGALAQATGAAVVVIRSLRGVQARA